MDLRTERGPPPRKVCFNGQPSMLARLGIRGEKNFLGPKFDCGVVGKPADRLRGSHVQAAFRRPGSTTFGCLRAALLPPAGLEVTDRKLWGNHSPRPARAPANRLTSAGRSGTPFPTPAKTT